MAGWLFSPVTSRLDRCPAADTVAGALTDIALRGVAYLAACDRTRPLCRAYARDSTCTRPHGPSQRRPNISRSVRHAQDSPILKVVTSGSPDHPSRTDQGTLARLNDVSGRLEAAFAYGTRFGPALDLALDEFLSTAQWPERERFRRRLTQLGLGDVNLDEMWRDMPRSRWEQATLVPDRIVLSLQALQEMPKAKPLLDTCMAIVRRAYELYGSDIDNPELRSDDPALVSAAGGEAFPLLCAREVLDQHRPDPLGGGGAGTDSTDWYRMLNDAAMPAFKDVVTVDDYLGAQAKIIANDREIYGRVPLLPPTSLFGTAKAQLAQPSAATPMHAGESLGSTSTTESPTGEDNKKATRSEFDRIVNRWGALAAAVAATVGALSDLTHLGWLTFVAAIIAGAIAVRYWRDSRRLLAVGLTVCLVSILLSVRTIAKPATTSFFYSGDVMTYPNSSPYQGAVPLTANPATGSQYDKIETPTSQTYTFIISCTTSGLYDGKPLVWAHIVGGNEPNLWIPTSFLSGLDSGKTYGLLSCSNWKWLLQLWSR